MQVCWQLRFAIKYPELKEKLQNFRKEMKEKFQKDFENEIIL